MKQAITYFLVDDDVDDQEIFASALYEVNPSIICVTSNSGIDALEKLADQSFNPDFIFLDFNMPGLTGKECLIEIKKNPRFQATPVVIYSTTVSERDLEEAQQAGAFMFLTKPSRFSELQEALTAIFSLQRKR